MQNKILCRSVFALMFLFLSACSGKARLTDADKLRVEDIYKSNCAGCHDAGTTGAPTRAALATRTPTAILAALDTGLMREQGKALKGEERKLIADYLGAGAAKVAGEICKGKIALDGKPLGNRWGNGIDNRRYQPTSVGGITPTNVSDLELKWAFDFPNAPRAQPAVTNEAIFTGSQDGRVYALDTQTGCILFAGALNGILRAYSTQDGRILWTTDTRRDWPTVNGVKGFGGAIDSAGPVVAGGLLIVNSGCDKFGQIPGNVLLVLGPKKRK